MKVRSVKDLKNESITETLSITKRDRWFKSISHDLENSQVTRVIIKLEFGSEWQLLLNICLNCQKILSSHILNLTYWKYAHIISKCFSQKPFCFIFKRFPSYEVRNVNCLIKINWAIWQMNNIYFLKDIKTPQFLTSSFLLCHQLSVAYTCSFPFLSCPRERWNWTRVERGEKENK